MLRTIIIFVAVLGLIGAAYVVYEWQDTTPLPHQMADRSNAPAMRPSGGQAGSQPAAIDIKGNKVSPGTAPIVRVIDPETGESRIVFQAIKWEPKSETTFHLTQPTARVLLPDGQLAYVRADEGEVVVQRDEKSNYNPKRGKLVGHVQLLIDRSKPEWRKANPDKLDPEQHPDAVVKIWMDDVSFDLDLARLQTPGPIIVQSADATIEGTGLTLVWNEVSRRIKLLKIERGKRALVHMKSLVQLGIARPEQVGEVKPADDGQSPEAPADEGVADASEEAAPEEAVETRPAAAPAPQPSQIRLTGLDEREDIKPDRIDTYLIVFNGDIVAEQRQGLRVVGALKADVLELLRDFGSQERSAVEHAQVSSRPAGAAGKSKRKRPADAEKSPMAGAKESTLELHWSGELTVTPNVQTDTQPAPAGGNRFHLAAHGNPVRLHDRENGDAVCRTLEYHDETQAVWLTGTPDEFVTLQADARRQISGERIFLDRKKGIARVEGAGRMTDDRVSKEKQEWPECVKEFLRKSAPAGAAGRNQAEDEDRQVLVTWKRGVEVTFGLQKVPLPDPNGGPPITKSKEYLKTAVFDGEVAFAQPGQTMSADHIEIVFAEPSVEAARPAGGMVSDRSVMAQTVKAEGNVQMLNDQSTITCDRLDVDMTANDLGENVPKTGRAFGHVVAHQNTQEIRAADGMVVTLESVPRKIDPEERARYEAAAKACGFTPESAEYKAIETKLAERRDTVLRTLVARRDVVVSDPGEEVDVAADSLECSFDDAQQIVRALVMGSKEVPCHVSMTDFYVRGPQIIFNVADQSAEVPGEGVLRFYTRQDLSGRRVDEPVPVVITWKSGMTFRGRQNTGMFAGSVRAVSENTILDCRELNLRFENLPTQRAASQPSGPDPRWLAGRVIDALTDSNDEKSANSATGISRDLRKRLAYLQAVGDCVITSSEYEQQQPNRGPFAYLVTEMLPELGKRLQPAPTREQQQLLSLVRIAGPPTTIDLNNEHMVVEGAGNLLVLDYRIPRNTGAEAPAAPDTGGNVLASSLKSSGPSQTLFTWQNSMSYLNQRNVAVLDSQVVMKHAAGSEMVLPDQVAAAMKKQFAAPKGRRAELTCENLVVEFTRNQSNAQGNTGSLATAAELKSFQASQRVRMQENSLAVEGEMITFDSGADLVRIVGSPQLPAWGADVDEKTGALRASWRGQELMWNLKTGVITSKGNSIRAVGR